MWILGSGFCGGVLGILFGALAGVLYWRSGRSSGTRAALGLAEAFRRVTGREWSRPATGAVVGAVDGGLFFGVVGTVVGAVAVYGGAVPEEVLPSALLMALFLVGGAAFFGVLAYTLTRAGAGAILPLAVCGIGGVLAGRWLAGVDGLLPGAILGVVAGSLVGLLWLPRYEPQFTQPSLDGTPPGPSGPHDGIRGDSDGVRPDE